MKKANRLLRCFLLAVFIMTVCVGIGSIIVSYADEVVRKPEYSNNAYQISTLGEFKWFVNHVNEGNNNSNAALTRNINFRGGSGGRIGSKDNQYSGDFNGRGYKLLNYNYDGEIFIYSKGTIRNLKVESGKVKGEGQMATLCFCNYGTIVNCGVSGDVFGDENVAGICVYNRGKISKCYNLGYVSGDKNTAGICSNNYGSIKDCYNAGVVYSDMSNENESDENISGVIVGIAINYENGSISDCINYGELKYKNGKVEKDGIGKGGSISNCYSTLNGNNFESGKITYLLNHKSTKDVVWGQQIGVDDYPSFNNYIVYAGYDKCIYTYANHTLNSEPIHTFTDKWFSDATNHYHKCSVCGDKKDIAQHIFNPWRHYDIEQHMADCSICAYEKFEKHSWGNRIVKNKPTEDINGLALENCPHCKGSKEIEIALDIELPVLNKVEHFDKEGLFDKHKVIIDASDKRSGVKDIYYAYIKNNSSIDDNVINKVKWEHYDGQFNYDPQNYASLYVKVVDYCDNYIITDSTCTTLLNNNETGNKYYDIRDITSY